MWSWPNTFHFFLPELLCWTVRDYGGMSSSLLSLVLLLLLLLVVLEIPFFAGGFVLLAAPFRQDFLCWQRLWNDGKVFGVLVVLCSNVLCLPGACTWVFGVAFLACCVVLLLSVLLLCCSLFCWVLDHVVAAVQLHESRHSSLCDSFFFLARIELAAACLGVLYMASFVLVEEAFLLSGLCGCVASGRGACWAQDAPQLLALLKGWQAWKHVRGRAPVCVFALRVGAGSQK